MARYFFDLHECGMATKDDEGIECSGVEAVRACAIKAAREVMCAELTHGRLCLSCHIDVKDERGASVLTIAFKQAVTISGL